MKSPHDTSSPRAPHKPTSPTSTTSSACPPAPAVVKEATKHLDPATLTAGKAADRAPALLRPALVGIGGAERLTRFAAASHTAPSPTPPQP